MPLGGERKLVVSGREESVDWREAVRVESSVGRGCSCVAGDSWGAMVLQVRVEAQALKFYSQDFRFS